MIDKCEVETGTLYQWDHTHSVRISLSANYYRKNKKIEFNELIKPPI